jgi:hypothetical protein
MLGGLSIQCIEAVMAVESATDVGVSLTSVEHVLAPTMKLGDMIVIGNLRAHKVAGVQQATKDRLIDFPSRFAGSVTYRTILVETQTAYWTSSGTSGGVAAMASAVGCLSRATCTLRLLRVCDPKKIESISSYPASTFSGPSRNHNQTQGNPLSGFPGFVSGAIGVHLSQERQ